MAGTSPQQSDEIDFNTLVLGFSSAALAYLGVLPEAEGETAHIKPNLHLAKHNIDILSVLAAKTRGNLSEQEAKLLEEVLFDLRSKFVEASSTKSK